MKRTVVALFVVALVVASASGVAADGGDDNEAPLVDAGLDQRVDPGARVVLDGGATRDPDGRIVSYSWSIETPNGTTTAPACPTCERTSFRATQRGVYTVTLAATDDDGTTGTDTLYVTVAGESEPPSVTLDGPGSTTAGSAATFTASFAPGSADLDRVVWEIDGTTVATESLAPLESNGRLQHAFGGPGDATVRVTVVDAANRSATAAMDVSVRSDEGSRSSRPSGGGAGGSAGGGGGDGEQLRAEIVGPAQVEPGEGVVYEVRLYNTASAEGPDDFAYRWANVDGSAGLAVAEAYREFDVASGTNVSIQVDVEEIVGTNTAHARKTVHVVDDAGDVDFEANERIPQPEIEGPDVVTACEPTTATFEATDGTSGTESEYDSATSFEYTWSNVDDSTNRWAEREFEAEPGESRYVNIKVFLDKDGSGQGRRSSLNDSANKLVTVTCPESKDGDGTTTYTEYHWTEPGETKRANSTSAPVPDATRVKTTHESVSWVPGTQRQVSPGDALRYEVSSEYGLRETVTVRTSSTRTTVAATRPGSDWTRVAENVEYRVEDRGTVWVDDPRSKPGWADEWKLVDSRRNLSDCSGFGMGSSGCNDRDYKYTYAEYTWLDRWQTETVRTETQYVYQKRDVTTWYLWEYTTDPQERVTTYDPRSRDIEMLGSVKEIERDCEDAPAGTSPCDSGDGEREPSGPVGPVQARGQTVYV